MSRAFVLIGLLAAVVSAGAGPILARPGAGLTRFSFAEVHMGLPVRITLYAAGEPAARGAAARAFARVAALDRMMSDYRDDSELRRLERAAGHWVAASPELLDVLERSRLIAEHTGGAFDVTAGPVVALWREARRTGRAPEAARLNAVRTLVGWQLVEIDSVTGHARLARRGMRLDLGGIAKGYILQAAVDALKAGGVARALVEAGGDIVAGEAPPGEAGWRVDASGASPAFAARARQLVTAALATSGPAAQFVDIDGVRHSHVVDPRTGRALTGPTTVRVIASDGATADALATALTVLGRARGEDVLARFPGVIADWPVE